MIRFKQTFGSGIKCKVDAEYMISKYECSLLNANPLSGLLKIQFEKGNILNYQGDTKTTLSQKIEKGVGHDLLMTYVLQLLRLCQELQGEGLDIRKLILHPDWIYVNKEGTELTLMYCPVNGMALQYDLKLFLQDVVWMASLTGEERNQWKKWLDSEEEMSVQSLLLWGKGWNTGEKERKYKKEHNHVKYEKIYSDAPTDIEDDVATSIEDDAPTDTEDTLMDEDEVTTLDWEKDMSIFQSWNAEGFVKNSVEENYKYDEMDAPTCEDDEVDGTFIDSYSQKSENMSTLYPKIEIVSTGEEISVTKDEFKLGRSLQRADLVIKNNAGVSNIHAIILRQGNRYYLKDAHSTNGTSLNGKKIIGTIPEQLEDNSVIELYNEKLIFHV